MHLTFKQCNIQIDAFNLLDRKFDAKDVSLVIVFQQRHWTDSCITGRAFPLINITFTLKRYLYSKLTSSKLEVS